MNDLDVRVITPSEQTCFPYMLNPDFANKSYTVRAQPAVKADNHFDNVEQVVVGVLEAGWHTVRITHNGTLRNAQGQPLSQQAVSVFLSGNSPQLKPPLVLGSVLLPSGAIGLMWNSVVGQGYRIQFKDDLNTAGWTDVPGDFVASKQSVAAELPPPSSGVRFYRLLEVE